MTTYIVTVDGSERFQIEADFSQASSPIRLDGRSTPFQVADACHYPHKAADLLIEWSENQGCPLLGEDEEFEIEELQAAE